MTKLFEYGRLRGAGPDTHRVRGDLRRLPAGHDAAGDAAARFYAGAPVYVMGQLREVTSRELMELDELEAPEYRRTWIVPERADGSGLVEPPCWAYQYVGADFMELSVVAGENALTDAPRRV